MKQMVEEILAKDRGHSRTKKTAKELTIPSQVPHGSQSSTSPVPSAPANIRRPNYQQEQRQKRLSPLYQGDSTSVTPRNVETRKSNTSGVAKDERVSLQRLSLFQTHGSSHATPTKAPERIGRLGNGSEIWFFPSVHPKLSKELQVAGITCSAVGIITCPSPFIGPLFSAEVLLEDQPEIEREIQRGKEGIQLRLGAENPDRLRTLLRELFLRLNRVGLKRASIHFAKQPTSLVEKVLPQRGRGAAALLEGVSDGECWSILQRVLVAFPEADVHFHVEQGALLLRGDAKEVEAMVKVVKREVDQSM